MSLFGHLWRGAEELLRSGGPVLIPLAGVGLWIGYLLILRTLELWQVGWRVHALSVWRENPRHDLVMVRMILSRSQVLRQTLITSAPLMGLLGTVSGMMSTFRGLSDGALYQPSGGIAGGIAEALLTTQVGLGIALPALLWHRLLQRRAVRLLQRLAQAESEGGRYATSG